MRNWDTRRKKIKTRKMKQANFSKYEAHITKSGNHSRLSRLSTTIVGCKKLQIMVFGESV